MLLQELSILRCSLVKTRQARQKIPPRNPPHVNTGIEPFINSRLSPSNVIERATLVHLANRTTGTARTTALIMLSVKVMAITSKPIARKQ